MKRLREIQMGELPVKFLRFFIISASRFFGRDKRPNINRLVFMKNASLPYSVALMPIHALKAAITATASAGITLILGMASLAKILLSIVESVMVFVIYFPRRITVKNYLVHKYIVSASGIKGPGSLIPTSIPISLIQPFEIFSIHDCILALCQSNKAIGWIKRLENRMSFHSAFHWSSMKGLMNFSRYAIIFLIALLSESIALSQGNPTSGGPIPSTTYTTLPNNLGVPNGTTVSGSDITFPGAGGFATLTATGGEKDLYVETTGNDSNSGRFGNAKLTLASALAAVPAGGAHIHIGCGTFAQPTTPTVTVNNVIISGSGVGSTNSGSGCTILQAAAGVTGLEINNATYVTVENLEISNISGAVGADFGLYVHGAQSTNFTGRNLVVERSGSHAINITDVGTGNVNIWHLDTVVARAARGDGFHFAATNSNVSSGICELCTAASNIGWGFNLSATAENVFIKPIAIANTAGGYSIGGGADSELFISPYCEAGSGSSFVAVAHARLHVEFPLVGQCQTITGISYFTNADVVSYADALSDPAWNILAITAEPGAASPVEYNFSSGIAATSNFGLEDKTSGIFIMTCAHSTNACTFPVGPLTSPRFTSTVATGTAPLTITSTTTVPNLTASNHPKIQFCGTTSTCSATAEVSDQIVYGSAALVSGTPSAVTITGISPAFTSTTSYRCTATDDTTATNDLLLITAVSGSSFTITGPATTTDVVGYVCVGH